MERRGRPKRTDLERNQRYKSILIKVELKEKLDQKVKDKGLRNLSELLTLMVADEE